VLALREGWPRSRLSIVTRGSKEGELSTRPCPARSRRPPPACADLASGARRGVAFQAHPRSAQPGRRRASAVVL